MCGRYTLGCVADELIETFDLPGLTFEHVATYNVTPGQRAPVLARDRRGRRIGLLTWGLAPGWMDDPPSGLINARAESVAGKASFRDAFERRRCLVPADGFYEWRREGPRRTPFWLHPLGGGLVSLAGIRERWERPGVEARHTFAIVTTAANADVRPVHDRMPLVIDAANRDLWLDPASDLTKVRRLLGPAPDGTFERREVSARVNRAAEDDPGLIDPV